MTYEYADIHTHLNFSAFDVDRDEVIKRTQGSKTLCINVGTQIDTSKKAIEIAEAYEGMFAVVGLHPIHTSKSFHDVDELGKEGQGENSGTIKGFASRAETFDSIQYRALAEHPKVVAIGECGLDYFRLETGTRKLQREAFIAQIALANEVKKPLMLHIRNAYQDAFEIMQAEAHVPANVHFFAGTIDEAKLFLDLGCTFSFTGVITFASSYDEVVKYLPLDRIMTETDAPYVSPIPHRGKRNEPSYVSCITEKLAEIRGESIESTKNQVMMNVSHTFKI